MIYEVRLTIFGYGAAQPALASSDGERVAAGRVRGWRRPCWQEDTSSLAAMQRRCRPNRCSLSISAMNPTARARQLRKKPTRAEKALWRLLRDRRFAGYKFRRQHPFAGYYLDFYCAEARLVLEVDGGGHGFPQQQAHDAERDRVLAGHGILVKRIWNGRLRRELEVVRTAIWALLQERAPHPENVKPEVPVTARQLNPDREDGAPPHPGPLPVRRGEGEGRARA